MKCKTSMLVAVGVVQSLAMLMFLFMGGGEGPKSSSGGETTNSLSVRDRPNKIPEARDLKPAVNKESRDRMCAVLNAGVGCNVTIHIVKLRHGRAGAALANPCPAG